MKQYLSVFVLTASTIFLMRCNKYENGSNFSLITKKSRLVNSWELYETLLNEAPIQLNANSQDNEYIFEKNNEYIILGESNQSQQSEQKGTWSFDNKKENLITSISGITDTLIISKLKNKSLWLKKELQNGTLLYKYRPK